MHYAINKLGDPSAGERLGYADRPSVSKAVGLGPWLVGSLQ
jgi:hypothetical protein